MTELVQFKTGGMPWEDRLVIINKVFVDKTGIDDFAQKLANQYESEIRWNFVWSNQGHYVQPAKEQK
jgi:hypothetical protein